MMTQSHRVQKTMSVGALVFLYAPIVILVVFSFNASKIGVSWEGFTWHWYGRLMADPELWFATRNSMVVGLVSTGMALVLGLGLAVTMERMVLPGKRLLDGLLLLPLVIPEVMLGVALLLFFVMVQWPLGLATVTIGHVVFNLPLVTMVIRARLRKIDPVWEEAAKDLGATPWYAFLKITLPLLRPAILGAGLMAFTLSLDDFVVTFFTTGPGATTLPLQVFSMMRTGVSPAINALSAILVSLSMMLIAVALWLQRK